MNEKLKLDTEGYSYEDFEKWKKGVDLYSRFINSEIVKNNLDLETIGQLQAVFLKEKPAVFYLPNLSVLKDYLIKVGFKVEGNYVYDEAQVQDVIDTHIELFVQYEATNANELMKKLAKEPNSSAPIIRGLILGFPLMSIQAFNRTGEYKINDVVSRLYRILETDPNKQKFLEIGFFTEARSNNTEIFDFIISEIQIHQKELGLLPGEMLILKSELKEIIDMQPVNIYGNIWIECKDDLESKMRQERLRVAFENSGILNL